MRKYLRKTEKTAYIASSLSNQEVTQMQEKSANLNNLSTPEELLVKYPYANEIGWTPEGIEFLYRQNLVKGVMNERLLIYNDSFEIMLEFHKKQQALE